MVFFLSFVYKYLNAVYHLCTTYLNVGYKPQERLVFPDCTLCMLVCCMFLGGSVEINRKLYSDQLTVSDAELIRIQTALQMLEHVPSQKRC